MRRSRYLIAAGLTGIVGVMLLVFFGKVADSPREAPKIMNEGPPVVAVLPFDSPDQEYESEFFADGVHDDLLTQLTKLQSIRVISSTSVNEYRNFAGDIRSIGEELGADAILEGAVHIAHDRIRINVQLSDVRTGAHLWAETYDRELSPANIFDLRDTIARAIARSLDAELTAQDDRQLTIIPTENMAAYQAFHRAMQMTEKHFVDYTDPRFREALEEAVELDPTFSRAWAELITNLAYVNWSGEYPELNRRAEQGLETLKAVAPESGDYLLGLAGYVYYALKDYDRAHDLISRAMTMNPGDVRVLEIKSWIERRQGRFDAWLNTLMEARRLDPRNPRWVGWVAHALVTLHRYDEALAEIETSRLDSYRIDYFRNVLLFREHRNFGRLQEAMEELCQLHERESCGWVAYIGNRDYRGALDSFSQLNGPFQLPVTPTDLQRLLTYWLTNDKDLVAEWVSHVQIPLEPAHDAFGNVVGNSAHLAAAILAGLRGNSVESERLVQLWFRYSPKDWADRMFQRQIACRILGMLAATDAAVACIRDGLAEPSTVMPFLEPYLPFYDALRNDQEFIDMLAEIDGS
ncbi:MAG: hypothetical protein R3192_16630 [Woeseiaceae bacterium]|nr:hypothetical protein [Woeseiaceae bacterium]